MKDTSPSAQEWQALFQAAIEFRNAQCWTWMDDRNIFGVKNEETGEVGYCCVMGNAGQLFGLAVYLGTDGLLVYEMVMTGTLEPGDPEVLDYQRCLMLSFGERADLDKRDLDVIKATGFKFRGHCQWPQFRSYRPGYLPWHLTAAEARFLTTALQQALAVALTFKQDQRLLDSPKPGELFLVRVRDGAERDSVWKEEWQKPAPFEVEYDEVAEVDNARLQRIKNTASFYEGTWEVDSFSGPMIIGNRKDPKTRPYLARVLLCVDRDSGFIVDSLVAGPSGFLETFTGHFVEILDQSETLPKNIAVRKTELADRLAPIANQVGMRLEITRPLRAVDHARRALFDYFQ